MPATKLDAAEKLEGYLRARAWPISIIGTDTIRSSFRAGGSTFPLVVQFDAPWVRLTVLPIVRIPTESERAELLYEKLLRLNGEMMLARFSIDEDGDVLLSVEFPAHDLDPSELDDALDVLSHYASQHQPGLRTMVA